MGIKQVFGDLRELHRGVSELFENDAAEEEAARHALATSAQRFSQNAKEVVDDKLAFSATLMRAGEVTAANRLLEEVEYEVRTEEAALIETVNEVKVAHSMRRERVTRLRLARMLAVAALGATLLTFSAAGMAVAGFLKDRSQESRDATDADGLRLAATSANRATSRIGRDQLRRLRIGDLRVVLTKAQFDRLKKLTGGASIDEDGLADLLELLPQTLAQKLQNAMTVATAKAEEVTSSLESVALEAPKVERKKKHAARAAAQTSEEAEKEEPQPEQETPTPQPSDSGSDNESPEGEEGGDDPGQEEEGDTGQLPVPPIRP